LKRTNIKAVGRLTPPLLAHHRYSQPNNRKIRKIITFKFLYSLLSSRKISGFLACLQKSLFIGTSLDVSSLPSALYRELGFIAFANPNKFSSALLDQKFIYVHVSERQALNG
jgi:hypothetical protein